MESASRFPEVREAAVVDRARNGDGTSLTDLLRSHDMTMRTLAWRLVGDGDVVDDVLQDAYLKVHRSIAGFRGDAAFGTWLHRIVANTCVDHLRRRSARSEVSIETQAETAVPDGADRVLDSERIRQALLALPFEQRVVILLVDCDGYSYDETADVLGISVGAVGSRLYRARATLQQVTA